MKANKFQIFLALALAIFFLSQFAAELSFLVGPGPEIKKANLENSLDLMALSLSSRLHTEAAFVWLEAGKESADKAAVKTAMALLRQSIQRNPLDYQARYYLAKAYLRYSAVDNDYFELGVRELKRAARIRGSNKQIALDCSRVFFSLWPLLEDEDKAFATRLLAAAMPTLSWREFSPLVEMWALYVQDAPLLMDMLKLKPEFFGPAADQLVAAAIPIEHRRELLALFEVHTLDVAERRYNELGLQGGIGLEDARALLDPLLRQKRYYRLLPSSGFSAGKLAKLQRSLLLEVISGMFTDSKAQADPRTPSKLRDFIRVYIQEFSGLNDLDELQKLLEESGYFKDNDFSSLHLKTMIAYKKGNYGDIISEIESLRKTISFVKKEQARDYTEILLLLVDSYYSSKLMTTAEAISRELYRDQPDNPDIQYRVLRVQKILGEEGAPDKILNEKLAAVENSRFVTVAKPNVAFDVFLFNQPWIEITLAPALLSQLKPKQLVQVFVDGKIAFENYVDAVPAKIAIGPPFVGIESKVKVQITVI